MTLDEAIISLRSNPAHADLVYHAYLGSDVMECAKRFAQSTEFAEVLEMAQKWVTGRVVVDLGAGNGIASYAFAKAGAAKVISIEPDDSGEIGRRAAEPLFAGLPVEHIAAYGESIPLPDRSVDLVYARQVLHHTTDLPRTLRECARILKPGGAFFACREHVVDNKEELERFLANHVVHQLAGGENAYQLGEYTGAIQSAGLGLRQILGFYDSIINSAPPYSNRKELERCRMNAMRNRFWRFGSLLALFPGIKRRTIQRLEKQIPGRMYSFFAVKPANS